METIGVEGRTLKDAIEKACAELSVAESQLRYKLDVEHFRDPFGKARGVDTVRIIAWVDTSAPAPAPRRAPAEDAPAPPPRRAPAEDAPPAPRPPRRREVVEERDEEEAEASERSPRGEDDAPRVAATPALTGPVDEVVKTFVSGTLERMGITATVTAEQLEDRLEVSLSGVDGGALDHGQVSRAVKSVVYLANRISTGEREQLPRVTLAAAGEEEEDRAEKEAHLEAVAAKVAAQVLKDGRALTLKPMNSYERRVIHLAISRHEGVASRSIGDGQRKRIQVYPVGGEPESED